jgi:hypothetical protein
VACYVLSALLCEGSAFYLNGKRMTDLLLFSICVSLACTVIHVAVTWDGMVLNWAEPHLNFFFRGFLSKPFYECLICMSSFWTVLIWLLYVKPVTFELLYAVLITGGINTVISCFIENVANEKKW